MTFFYFVILSLASYRLQRIVTTDTWPPSEWFREALSIRVVPTNKRPTKKAKRWMYLYDFVTCPWCFGSILTFVIFGLAAQVVSLPLPVAQALAGAAVVGIIGERD